jgi:hypothetical protein
MKLTNSQKILKGKASEKDNLHSKKPLIWMADSPKISTLKSKITKKPNEKKENPQPYKWNKKKTSKIPSETYKN